MEPSMLLIELPKYTPIDMFQLLSQVKVFVPFLEMLRIVGKKQNLVALINGATIAYNDLVVPTQPKVSDKGKEDKEVERVITIIPHIFLGNSVTSCPGKIDPFFLALIVEGNLLKNCIIGFGASNNIMPSKIVEALGLKVDNTHGKFYAMDSREVLITGVINELPYRLETYPYKEFKMSVVVVDISPNYKMFLSRKWSASMEDSMQCDMSYATFPIDGKNVQVVQEPNVPHMMDHAPEDDTILFIDVDINDLKVEEAPREIDRCPTPIDNEAIILFDKDELWKM